MTKFLGVGPVSAMAAALLFLVGSSGQALAQQVSNHPVVQAVVKTTTNAASAVSAPASIAPAPTGPVDEVAQEASWLSRNGWPLYALVDRFGTGAALTDEAQCIAVAVYHEARGESLEGQLAVAKVIMNRAASGQYPDSWCSVVKQPWQFSFVRKGRFPSVDEGSTAWRRAIGVTRLAVANAWPTVTDDVLWYHADYVAPSWGRRLTKASRIGTHIFYRS